MHRTTAALAVGLLSCTLASPGTAQRLTVTPTVGAYLPVTRLTDGGTAAPKARSTIALGGRVAYLIDDRLGIEATVSYAPSGVKFASDSTRPANGHVTSESARLLVRVVPSPRLTAILTGGFVLVQHGGEAYVGGTGNTRLGGVLGGGLTLPVGRRGLAAQFNLDDYFYSTFESDLGPGFAGIGRRKLQNDLQLTAGLSIPLIRDFAE